MSEGGCKFFRSVLAHLGLEQHDNDVAIANNLVVLVPQPGLRQRVEKILPHDEFEEDTFVYPFLVLAVDGDLELISVGL